MVVTDHATTLNDNYNLVDRKTAIKSLDNKELLYNCIFEGLKSSLNQILEDKACEGYHTNYFNGNKKEEFSSDVKLNLNIYNEPESTLYRFYQPFFLETNIFKNNQNLKQLPFFEWSFLQNKFLKLNILKLNHQIKGGSVHLNNSLNTLRPSVYLDSLSNDYKILSRYKNKLSYKKLAPNYTNQEAPFIINENLTEILPTIGSKPWFTNPEDLTGGNLKSGSSIGYFKTLKNKFIVGRTIDTAAVPPGMIIQADSFNNKNSFLFLTNYIKSLNTNIKKILTPYKLRSTYLPEISGSKYINSGRGNYNYLKSKSPSQTEKIFLSFFSKVKKPYKNEPFLKSNKMNLNKTSSLLLVKQPITNNFKNIKLKGKINLQKKLSSCKAPGSGLFSKKYKIKFISSQVATPFNSFVKKTNYVNPILTGNSKLFLSKQITFFKSNKSLSGRLCISDNKIL